MGFLNKLFGGAKPAGRRHIEWPGEVIEVRLDPIEPERWLALMEGRDIRNRWADLGMVPNRNGRPKVVVSVAGTVVGEVPAAKLTKDPGVNAALAQDVNVGVVSLRHRYGEVAAILYLGRGYKYRPKPPWGE